MRIAITGGRDHKPTKDEVRKFLVLVKELGMTECHHGAAPGVDSYIAKVCDNKGYKTVAHKANWDLYGPSAGPIRNMETMAASEALIAFPGGKGTMGTIRIAVDSEKPVYKLWEIQ